MRYKMFIFWLAMAVLALFIGAALGQKTFGEDLQSLADEKILDRCGKVQGHITGEGKILDRNLKVRGRITDDGKVLDRQNKIRGYIYQPKGGRRR